MKRYERGTIVAALTIPLPFMLSACSTQDGAQPIPTQISAASSSASTTSGSSETLREVYDRYHSQPDFSEFSTQTYQDGKLLINWGSAALQGAVSFNISCVGTTLVVERPGFDAYKTVEWKNTSDPDCNDHKITPSDMILERTDIVAPDFKD